MRDQRVLPCILYRSSLRGRSHVHWLEAWPSRAGYTTVQSARVAGFSRHLLRSLNQVFLFSAAPEASSLSLSLSLSPQPSTGRSSSRPASATPHPANSLSPFHTSMKPTCGFFFSHETDNRFSVSLVTVSHKPFPSLGSDRSAFPPQT